MESIFLNESVFSKECPWTIEELLKEEKE